MATEPAAASDHRAPSEEVERIPRSEAKYMEAETVAPVKHEEPACPAPTSTESEAERVEKKVEPLPVNERVEGDIKPKAVATSLAEPIEIKTEDVDNKALELPSAEEKKKTQVAEHKPVELSISEPSTLKDVTEAEFKVEEVSPAAPKAGVIEAELLGRVELKSQTLPKEEESGATEDPTIRVEECYPTEEVEEKTGEEKEPPAKEIIEVKEKVSDPGKIEATSEEKRGATEEFVQFEENPTNDANTAEDEVTDKETLQATEEKMKATVGDIKTEFEGETQVTQRSDPLPEPIVEYAKTEVGHKKASEETDTNEAEDKFKETALSTEEKIQETVATINAELEEEKQVDETVSDAKISEPLLELIAENAKIKAYNKESSEELQKNVAAESINETVKATDDTIEEAVGATKAELEGEKQVDEPVHDAKRLPEPITENSKREADNKEASEETDKNVAAEKIKESVQATEEKIEESVRTIKAEVEGEKQVEDPVNDAKCSNPLPKLIAENAKTEADNKESSDELGKNVAAEKIEETMQATDEKIEETVGNIKAEIEGEKQVEESVNDAKISDPLHELVEENAKTEADNKESSDELERNVAAECIKESVQATDDKIEETVGTIEAEVEGEKQVEEPVNDAKSSDSLPELIAGNVKTKVDNKESSDVPEKNVAADSIKETGEKNKETVGAIKAELDGEKQLDEPLHDAKTSDHLPERIAENAKTEADNKETSEETGKNVAAEKIKDTVQSTEEKIEETVRTIKAELDGEKEVAEPVNDAKSSDPLPELIAENAKTEEDNKESSDEPEKNVAAESKKESLQATEEKVDELVKNPECIKEIEDTKKPQDVPVKTHKQSIVKMVKQSLVKAKKAITGKSHNSKTQASEPKDEGN